ncbi:MAG TPA: DUF2807 domain-containing protein [Chitinispirillaceae bacterium]|nr:DUF2807 domain-containing protein [Chitinispirillaceae bacterium]
MKTVLFITIAVSSLLSSCIFPTGIVIGSDDTVVVSKSFSGFSKVAVSNACEAVVTRAETYSVSVEINENLEDHLNINLKNGCLDINLDNNYSYHHLTFKVKITMPELENVSCCDASRMTISGFNSEKTFSAAIYDASKLNGSLNCGDILMKIYDASQASLTGTGKNLTCTVNDASTLKFKTMKCNNAALTIADASEAEIYVSGNLTGKVTDASKVVYYGNVVQGTLSVKDGSKVVRGD